MARDYKNASGRAAKNGPRPVGSWASFMSGLGIGLVIAVGTYVWCDHAHRVVANGMFQTQPAAPQPEPTLPPEPENIEPAQALPKPTFDFYKILPEIEVKVPETELAQPGPNSPQTGKPGAYLLQVGSYQKFEEADQAKAQLALQGIQAKIHRVVINGQDVWYRVHLGPYTKLEDVQTMRARLTAAGASYILLKIGEPEPN